MKRLQTREVVRRALTSFISMTPWPLEMAGAFMLWHYGKLFTSNVVLSSDFDAIIAQIMPGNTWGVFARALACALWGIGALSIATGARFYVARLGAAIAGLICWGVLAYSCWRNSVPFKVYEIWVSYVLIQAYVALVIKTRIREDEGKGGANGHR